MVSFGAFFSLSLPFYYYDRLNSYLLHINAIPNGWSSILARVQREFVLFTLVYVLFGQVSQIYISLRETDNILLAMDSLAWVILGLISLEVLRTTRLKAGPITELILELQRIYPEDDSILEKINVKQILGPMTWILSNFQRVYVITLSFRIMLPFVLTVVDYFRNDNDGGFVLKLPLHVWYPFDAYNPVWTIGVYIFEFIAATISTCPLLMVSALVGGLSSVLCVQLKLLACEFEELKKRNLETLKTIMERHCLLIRLSRDLNDIFSSFLLCNYVFCSIGISLFMFVAVASEDKELIIEYTGNLICYIFFIGTFSLFGHRLMEHSVSISSAVYKGHWLDIDIKYRKHLLMVMIRSSQPLFLTGNGFVRINFESFTKILTSSYSYFALLRTSYNR